MFGLVLAAALAPGCSGARLTDATNGMTPAVPALKAPSGLTIRTIAAVPRARELVDLPNGDLIVGTNDAKVYIVPNAESSAAAAAPRVFATIDSETVPPGEPDGGNNPAGVAFSRATCTLYIATEYHVWSTPYRDGDMTAEDLRPIATVRTGPSNATDHITTSLAISGSTLFAGMGSDCNSCQESDPERAAIWKMHLDGSHKQLVAKNIRNAIALTANPESGHLWAGDAGQDDLATMHPYEFVDDVTASAAGAGGIADYGWPYCEENHTLYKHSPAAPANCEKTVQPLIEYPAYTTHIGATFYPLNPRGAYAFPAKYRGALISSRHGSWHVIDGCALAPEVDYVPMNGDKPKTSVDWRDPTKQYEPLVTGFQPPNCGTRVGRATGVTIGIKGSVFVADDEAGLIYRIRP